MIIWFLLISLYSHREVKMSDSMYRMVVGAHLVIKFCTGRAHVSVTLQTRACEGIKSQALRWADAPWCLIEFLTCT